MTTGGVPAEAETARRDRLWIAGVLLLMPLPSYVLSVSPLFHTPVGFRPALPAAWLAATAITLALVCLPALRLLAAGPRLIHATPGADRAQDMRWVVGLVFLALWQTGWLYLVENIVYYSDDAFYYIRVAQHIVGQGWSTFDGVSATNGYHPLWMGVLVAVVALASWLAPESPHVFLNLSHTVQALIYGGILAVLYLMFRRAMPPLYSGVAAASLTAMPALMKTLFMGMESSVLLLIILAGYYHVSGPRLRPAVWFYVTIPLAILARIDTGLLWAVFAAAVIAWRGREGMRLPAATIRSSAATLAAGAVGAGLSFAYNYAIAGQWVSTSGLIKRDWVAILTQNVETMPPLHKLLAYYQAAITQGVLEYPARTLFHWFGFLVNDPAAGTAAYLATTGGFILALAAVCAWANWRLLRFTRTTGLLAFGAFCILLTAAQKYILFQPGSPFLGGLDYQQLYYHYPTLLVVFFILAGAWFGPGVRRGMPARWVGAWLLAVTLMMTLDRAGIAFNRPYMQRQSAVVLAAVEAGEPITRVWEPHGGQVAFNLGYYGINVMNGDGLMNSMEYMRQVRWDGEVEPWLRAHGFDYFILMRGTPEAHAYWKMPFDIVDDPREAVLLDPGKDMEVPPPWFGTPDNSKELGKVRLYRLTEPDPVDD